MTDTTGKEVGSITCPRVIPTLMEASGTLTFEVKELNPEGLDWLMDLLRSEQVSTNPCLAISGDGDEGNADNLDCRRDRHVDPWHIDGRFRPRVGVLAWRALPDGEVEVLNTVTVGHPE